MSLLETIKDWFRKMDAGPKNAASTNAQVEGAVGEPYPGTPDADDEQPES
ncbi:MAG: hypothetical protein KGI93_05605 [Acidobacteriota bacterium]|nr:hypothetical protein [Acidobacteriota bacterium]MDE3190432.1 hypothetical protein [Acidobacteriota bacterium]